MRRGVLAQRKQWAQIEPHLPTNHTGAGARWRPTPYQRHHSNASVRRTLARLPARLWSLHDDLQSFRSLG